MARNPEEFQKLLEELKNNRTPSKFLYNGTLYIRSLELNDSDAKALAKALVNNRMVTGLDLKDNNIGPTGAEALAKMLETNHNITYLNLSKNKIGDPGAIAIASCLKKKVDDETESMKELDLSHSNIGSKGTAAIANALCDSKQINYLYLGGNHICSQRPSDIIGVTALRNLLQSDTSLQILDISSTGIDTKSIVPIATGLGANKALVELDISSNKDIGPKGIMLIAQMLKSNSDDSKLNSIRINKTCQDDQKVEHHSAINMLMTATSQLTIVGHEDADQIRSEEVRETRRFLAQVKNKLPQRGGAAAQLAALKAKQSAISRTSKPSTSQPSTSQPSTSQPSTSQPDNSQPRITQPRTSKSSTKRGPKLGRP